MSSVILKAIYERLAGVEILTGKALAAQTALVGLLGVDADTTLPAVYMGNLNDSVMMKDANAVMRPVITFRPSGGLIDKRFETAVDDPIYDFEIWSFSRQARIITDIEWQMGKLIDSRRYAPDWNLDSGAIANVEPLTTLAILYDHQRNGWFGLIRYKFTEVLCG